MLKLNEYTEFRLIQELAEDYGIPLEGLWHCSSVTRTPWVVRLFRRQCASCHAYNATGENAQPVIAGPEIDPNAEGPYEPLIFTCGFGSPVWIWRLLNGEEDGITSPKYFGNTIHVEGEMVAHVRDTMWAEAETDEDKAGLKEAIEQVSGH